MKNETIVLWLGIFAGGTVFLAATLIFLDYFESDLPGSVLQSYATILAAFIAAFMIQEQIRKNYDDQRLLSRHQYLYNPITQECLDELITHFELIATALRVKDGPKHPANPLGIFEPTQDFRNSVDAICNAEVLAPISLKEHQRLREFAGDFRQLARGAIEKEELVRKIHQYVKHLKEIKVGGIFGVTHAIHDEL